MRKRLTLGHGLLLLIAVLVSTSCSLLLTRPKLRTAQERWQDFNTTDMPVSAPVRIYWNSQKVPFIEASNDQDLAFALGYIHGYLRHYQLQTVRMISMGRLAEMGGPWAEDIDKTLRIMNFEKAVPEIIKSMPPDTKKWSESFLAGLNRAFALDIPKPADAEALNIPNEQWTMTDLVRFWRMAGIDINWMVYAKFLGLKKEKGWEKFYQDMVKVNGDTSLIAYNDKQQGLYSALNYFNRSGSNSFAISGKKTASGKAILANDPHLGIALPAVWLLVGIKSPSYHAAGFMIPGLPFIAVGRNANVAWGGTNMRGLSSYLYELNEKDVAEAEVRTEKVKVRWWFDSEVDVRYSKFGPILTDSPYAQSEKPLALYWVGHRASDEVTAFLKANRAKNWREFRKAFATYAVSAQNILYADDQGHIGHLLAYKKPLRKNPNSTELITSRDNPVVGHKTPVELKAKFDPPEGFLASANNNPADFENVGMFFSTHDRIQRLNDILGKGSQITIDDVKRLHDDVYSAGAVKIRNLILENAKANDFTASQETNPTWLNLVQWTGNYDAKSAGALAFEVSAIHLAKDYFKDRYQFQPIADAALKETHWKTLLSLHFREVGAGKDFVSRLQKALVKAHEIVEEHKNWGGFRYTPVSHLLGGIPYIGGRYRFWELPANGNADTLFKRASSQKLERSKVFYGQNSRHISLMEDVNENYFMLFGGNDGYLDNPHLTDLLSLYEKRQYVKVPLDMNLVRKYFKHKTSTLTPSDSGAGSNNLKRSTK